MSAEEKPEERFKTLINIGIGFSILIIIGIFVTIGITRSKIAERPEQDMEAWTRYWDSVNANNYVVDDYDYYSDPGDRYDYGPGPTERENDSLNREIRNGYVYSYQEELLDHLDTESDNCARLIHELIVAFKDTLNQSGVSYSASTSIAFFDNSTKDEEVFSTLFAYRETTEEYGENAGLYDPVSFRMYLPLMETSDYSYIKTWNKSEFEQDPDQVIQFLERLEMDLRYYENHVLWDLRY